jgi:DNA-binding PadR family transcriptional regulator
MMDRVLDIAILGLLMERDHHGYEIRSQLRDRLGMWANVSFGSIYPALARLERHGFVEAVLPVAPRLTSLSTGLGRRGRKVYRITESGRVEFVSLLSDPSTLDSAKNFSLRMALAKHLSPTRRVGLLERRRADLLERLVEVRAGERNEELDDYARGVMEHAARGVELDLAWIDDLLNTERSNQTFANEAK